MCPINILRCLYIQEEKRDYTKRVRVGREKKRMQGTKMTQGRREARNEKKKNIKRKERNK